MAWILQLQENLAFPEKDLSIASIDYVARTERGTFMTEMETIRTLKQKKQWLGNISDRSSFFEFESIGNRSMVDLAKAKVKDILSTTGSEAMISPEKQRDINSILEAIKADLL